MGKFGPISHGIICNLSGGFVVEVARWPGTFNVRLLVASKVYFGRQIEV